VSPRRIVAGRVRKIGRASVGVRVLVCSTGQTYRVLANKPSKLWAVVPGTEKVEAGAVVFSAGILKGVGACSTALRGALQTRELVILRAGIAVNLLSAERVEVRVVAEAGPGGVNAPYRAQRVGEVEVDVSGRIASPNQLATEIDVVADEVATQIGFLKNLAAA